MVARRSRPARSSSAPATSASCRRGSASRSPARASTQRAGASASSTPTSADVSSSPTRCRDRLVRRATAEDVHGLPPRRAPSLRRPAAELLPARRRSRSSRSRRGTRSCTSSGSSAACACSRRSRPRTRCAPSGTPQRIGRGVTSRRVARCCDRRARRRGLVRRHAARCDLLARRGHRAGAVDARRLWRSEDRARDHAAQRRRRRAVRARARRRAARPGSRCARRRGHDPARARRRWRASPASSACHTCRLAALTREVSPRERRARDRSRCAACSVLAGPTCCTRIPRRPARRVGSPRSLAGPARPRARRAHVSRPRALAATSTTGASASFRLIERALALSTDRIVAVSEQVRDDLVALPRRAAARRSPSSTTASISTHASAGAAAARAGEARRAGGRRRRVRRSAGPAGCRRSSGRSISSASTARGARTACSCSPGTASCDRPSSSSPPSSACAERVRILGYVEDIGSWYGAFDAFLLTSANEGAPVVAIEALAAGLPVVATDAGGTRTVVDDGETGFLAPIGDVERARRAAARAARRSRPARSVSARPARTDARAVLDRTHGGARRPTALRADPGAR